MASSIYKGYKIGYEKNGTYSVTGPDDRIKNTGLSSSEEAQQKIDKLIRQDRQTNGISFKWSGEHYSGKKVSGQIIKERSKSALETALRATGWHNIKIEEVKDEQPQELVKDKKAILRDALDEVRAIKDSDIDKKIEIVKELIREGDKQNLNETEMKKLWTKLDELQKQKKSTKDGMTFSFENEELAQKWIKDHPSYSLGKLIKKDGNKVIYDVIKKETKDAGSAKQAIVTHIERDPSGELKPYTKNSLLIIKEDNSSGIRGKYPYGGDIFIPRKDIKNVQYKSNEEASAIKKQEKKEMFGKDATFGTTLTNVKRGDKVTYTKEYAFGKTDKITAKVVMVNGNKALLDNGDEIFVANRANDVNPESYGKVQQANVGATASGGGYSFTKIQSGAWKSESGRLVSNSELISRIGGFSDFKVKDSIAIMKKAADKLGAKDDILPEYKVNINAAKSLIGKTFGSMDEIKNRLRQDAHINFHSMSQSGKTYTLKMSGNSRMYYVYVHEDNNKPLKLSITGIE